jgi:CdiI immunity protein
MSHKTEVEILQDFFRAYFHEDWGLDATTPDEVVMEFLNLDWEPAELQTLEAALVSYVNSHEEESQLQESLFRELGCYYMPQSEGIPVRKWLLGLASRFGGAAKDRLR